MRNTVDVIQVYPSVYQWNTFGITTLLKKLWLQTLPSIDKGLVIDPLLVELCAVLERALNYMHTGNAKVLATTVMRPLWTSQALVQHGLPALSPIVRPGTAMTDPITVLAPDWPVNPATLHPYSAAHRSQVFTYGSQLARVSGCSIPTVINHP
jgi:hypothetical protein